MSIQMYQRMFNAGAYAASYMLGAFILFWLLQDKKVGHRILLKWGAWYLTIRAATLVGATIAIYKQSYDITSWLSTSTALMSFVLFTYFFSVRHDVKTTLEDSEHASRVNCDKISDVVMAARNLKIIAKSTRESLHATIAARRRVAATNLEHHAAARKI